MKSILDYLFECRVIVNCDHDPYLYRWYVIRTKHFGLFIHKFIRSDEDRALHDHPWSFIVIPIWRGYMEVFPCKYFGYDENARRVLPVFGSRIRKATFRHRVQLIDKKPSWSIFIRFTKIREWGFWPKEGFTLWNKWWQDKCGD